MPAQKKKRRVSKPKLDAAIITKVTREIHKRRSKPRKMLEWLKRLRNKLTIVYATGIIVTGTYLSLDPARRKAFKNIFNNMDQLVTAATQVVSGGSRLVVDATKLVRYTGETLGTMVYKATADVTHLAKESEQFKENIMATVITNTLHGMSVHDILKQYSEYMTRPPSLVKESFNTRVTHTNKNSLLKHWIPYMANHAFTRDAMKKAGVGKNHENVTTYLVHRFHEKLRNTVK